MKIFGVNNGRRFYIAIGIVILFFLVLNGVEALYVQTHFSQRLFSVAKTELF
jgi:hypothetical protein